MPRYPRLSRTERTSLRSTASWKHPKQTLATRWHFVRVEFSNMAHQTAGSCGPLGQMLKNLVDASNRHLNLISVAVNEDLKRSPDLDCSCQPPSRCLCLPKWHTCLFELLNCPSFAAVPLSWQKWQKFPNFYSSADLSPPDLSCRRISDQRLILQLEKSNPKNSC